MRYIVFLAGLFFLAGCSESAIQSNYAAPVEQKQIAPIERSVDSVQKNDADVPLSNDNTYINSKGNEVHSPAYAPSRPAGASALCADGTYSFSQSRRGTCSHHGGVMEWY